MWSARPVFIFPRSFHSFNDLLRPYTFDEYLSFSDHPPTRTHEKLDVGGRPTHDAFLIPNGSSGPCIHFRFSISNISVVLKNCFWPLLPLLLPPIMMMDCVDPSSAGMAQLEWWNLGVSNDGPSVQLFSIVS